MLGGLAVASTASVGTWVGLGRPEVHRLLWDADAPPAPPPASVIYELRRRMPSDRERPRWIEQAREALLTLRPGWWYLPSPFRGLPENAADEALSILRDRARDDYEAGRTITVASWMISRTEAELLLWLG